MSVLSSADTIKEIILVDDCSNDGTKETIKDILDSTPRISYLRSDTNIGPAAARNIGAAVASSACLAFIDSDVVVGQNWLSGAKEVFDLDESIGAIQSKILVKGLERKVDYVGDYLADNGFLIQRAGLGDNEDTVPDQVVPIFGAKSAGMFVKADVFRHAGRFDSDFFIYMEETDLCWRIWLSGKKVVYAPHSSVFHVGSARLGDPEYQRRLRSRFKYHGSKNYLMSILKNTSLPRMIPMVTRHLTMWSGIIAWHVLSGRSDEALVIMKGLWYNFANLRRIISKRAMVQEQVRCTKDSEIFPIICRRAPLSYFYDKLGGQRSGWK